MTDHATLISGFNITGRMVMKGLFVSCLAALAATGCAAIPPKIHPHASHNEAFKGCSDLNTWAEDRASQTASAGWTFAIAGASAAAAGTTVIPLDGTLSNHQKMAAATLVAAGALLLKVSQAWFHRSDAASTLAGETAATIGTREDDQPLTGEQLAAKCNTARSAWDKSSTDATAVAATLLQEQKKEKAADARSSAARLELEKVQLDFKLKVIKANPSFSVEQIDKLVTPPVEPPPADKAQPPADKLPAPPR
jgi:hypothetical protein